MIDLEIETINRTINNLIDHKNRQIDENRKISARIDKLEKLTEESYKKLKNEIGELNKYIQRIDSFYALKWKNLENELNILKNALSNIPNKCPNCNGSGIMGIGQIIFS